MARIHRRNVQKNLHDPNNHDGVITALEPDILDCEVKWALESITMNKASGSDGIPVELLLIVYYSLLFFKTQITNYIDHFKENFLDS